MENQEQKSQEKLLQELVEMKRKEQEQKEKDKVVMENLANNVAFPFLYIMIAVIVIGFIIIMSMIL